MMARVRIFCRPQPAPFIRAYIATVNGRSWLVQETATGQLTITAHHSRIPLAPESETARAIARAVRIAREEQANVEGQYLIPV